MAMMAARTCLERAAGGECAAGCGQTAPLACRQSHALCQCAVTCGRENWTLSLVEDEGGVWHNLHGRHVLMEAQPPFACSAGSPLAFVTADDDQEQPHEDIFYRVHDDLQQPTEELNNFRFNAVPGGGRSPRCVRDDCTDTVVMLPEVLTGKWLAAVIGMEGRAVPNDPRLVHRNAEASHVASRYEINLRHRLPEVYWHLRSVGYYLDARIWRAWGKRKSRINGGASPCGTISDAELKERASCATGNSKPLAHSPPLYAAVSAWDPSQSPPNQTSDARRCVPAQCPRRDVGGARIERHSRIEREAGTGGTADA